MTHLKIFLSSRDISLSVTPITVPVCDRLKIGLQRREALRKSSMRVLYGRRQQLHRQFSWWTPSPNTIKAESHNNLNGFRVIDVHLLVH